MAHLMGLAVLGPVMRFEKDVRERFRKCGGRLSGLGIIAVVAQLQLLQ
jgi:hypothetical protein